MRILKKIGIILTALILLLLKIIIFVLSFIFFFIILAILLIINQFVKLNLITKQINWLNLKLKRIYE